MRIRFHRNFEKQYKKFSAKTKAKIRERLSLFLRDEFDPILNNHPLRGKYGGYRSINISGDLRAVYKLSDQEIRVFVAVATHNTLYK
ncbi:MAG TPA: type II toxin-antitoxin system mRNA interferase toxin, RelE/StbE family [Candidatus Tyrphobacter sp.]|nr:type II toxin-antitoxin system mRNA interferase toxin, RelE/StbE family [Candidatus Tyrphobacter sp.]